MVHCGIISSYQSAATLEEIVSASSRKIESSKQCHIEYQTSTFVQIEHNTTVCVKKMKVNKMLLF